MDYFRDRVRERDLDNFLVEELSSSPEFLRFVLTSFDANFSAPVDCEVKVEKSPPREQDGRQTDVRIGWFDSANELKACVLVESKVTDGFQPGQAEAYAAEADAISARLGQNFVRCLLVAPSSRLAALDHHGAFEAELSIEEIIKFLSDRAGEVAQEEIRRRLNVRVQLLEALCGKRPQSTWIASTIDEKRDFAHEYSQLAAEILPSLGVRPSTDGPKATTRIFEGLSLEGLPPSTLRHEFGDGVKEKYANIQFRGCGDRVSAIDASGVLADTDFWVANAGQSAAIRVATPAINPLLPFEVEADKVRQSLYAIRGLVTWLEENLPSVAKVLNGNEIPSDKVSLPAERDFRAELMATYSECEKLGYRPTEMLQMIEDHGAIETAKRLITGPPSDGFAKLAMLGRLDLSVESIVQKEPWRRLFTDAELRRAKQRLR